MSIEPGAHAELRAWYLGHLRPRLVEAVAAGIVGPGAVEALDLQVAGLVEVPERADHESSPSVAGCRSV